jgi:hypothetical protein
MRRFDILNLERVFSPRKGAAQSAPFAFGAMEGTAKKEK